MFVGSSEVLQSGIDTVTPETALTIKVRYLVPGLEKLSKIEVGDWIDLRCAQDMSLSKGGIYLIPLGIAMELPKGYEAWLTSRSSMATKFHIQHCDDLGVIDNSYCGDNDEWKLPVIALQDTELHLNDRICQFRIHRTMPPVIIQEVDVLGNPDRGGIGSTGTR